MATRLCRGLASCGAVAQSVERATTPGEEAVGSVPVVATRSLLVGSVSVYCKQLRQKSWPPRSVSYVAVRIIIRRQSWDPPRYSLVADEDVKKPNRQTNKQDWRLVFLFLLLNMDSVWETMNYVSACDILKTLTQPVGMARGGGGGGEAAKAGIRSTMGRFGSNHDPPPPFFHLPGG